jgi:hypothetical protein
MPDVFAPESLLLIGRRLRWDRLLHELAPLGHVPLPVEWRELQYRTGYYGCPRSKGHTRMRCGP